MVLSCPEPVGFLRQIMVSNNTNCTTNRPLAFSWTQAKCMRFVVVTLNYSPIHAKIKSIQSEDDEASTVCSRESDRFVSDNVPISASVDPF